MSDHGDIAYTAAEWRDMLTKVREERDALEVDLQRQGERLADLKRERDQFLVLLQQQADRIAWLEGDVAGWRIKLAECIEDAGRYCDALERIAAWPVIAENPRLAAAVRAALDGTPSELAECEASR